mmetsp:Transcript_39133/g.44800  ORF Transcript_39133/g.44800 Transcript_39133/m.44800 type:complete len:180 (+) Transcript_39133:1139-1678(+)
MLQKDPARRPNINMLLNHDWFFEEKPSIEKHTRVKFKVKSEKPTIQLDDSASFIIFETEEIDEENYSKMMPIKNEPKHGRVIDKNLIHRKMKKSRKDVLQNKIIDAIISGSEAKQKDLTQLLSNYRTRFSKRGSRFQSMSKEAKQRKKQSTDSDTSSIHLHSVVNFKRKSKRKTKIMLS